MTTRSISHDSRGRAFGGGCLLGTNIMRKAFLDEAGISRPKDEPFVVTAGVVIHGDSQWMPVSDYLQEMIDEYEPPEGFFHAFKLYGGLSPYERDNGWGEDKRFEVLEQLAHIPEDFDLPVVYGIAERAKVAKKYPEKSPAEADKFAHLSSAVICMMQVERYMRMVAQTELAEVVIEDSPHIREAIKDASRFFKNPVGCHLDDFELQYLPIRQVMGVPQFTEKRDASVLQIADVCAYVIKRQMMRDPKIERFFNPFAKRLAFAHDDEPDHPLYRPWEREVRRA